MLDQVGMYLKIEAEWQTHASLYWAIIDADNTCTAPTII